MWFVIAKFYCVCVYVKIGLERELELSRGRKQQGRDKRRWKLVNCRGKVTTQFGPGFGFQPEFVR